MMAGEETSAGFDLASPVACLVGSAAFAATGAPAALTNGVPAPEAVEIESRRLAALAVVALAEVERWIGAPQPGGGGRWALRFVAGTTKDTHTGAVQTKRAREVNSRALLLSGVCRTEPVESASRSRARWPRG